MSAVNEFDAALVPMQLEAFVLNPAVCGSDARIAPVTQPNYTFLRLSNFLIQADVQNHVDLHATSPAEINSRVTDLGANPPRPLRHRHGVYLHWTLPRFYRSGVSLGKTAPEHGRSHTRLERGLPVFDAGTGTGIHDTPDFAQPPTRWVVVREMDLDSIQPESARESFRDSRFEAWVVESDYLWSLDKIPEHLDLQTDMAPFVMGQPGANVNIEEQAEVFIGRKTPLRSWTGVEKPDTRPPSLSLLASGNQLFADFQMHNANVFSVLDNFRYGDDSDPKYLDSATCNYYVLGWHWKDDVDPLWNSGAHVTHGASLDALFMKLAGVGPDDGWLDRKSQLRIMCHGAMYNVRWHHDRKPETVPADGYARRLQDQTMPAMSVGTTPMDAIISYCTARNAKPNTRADVATLEEDILAIESLLHATDDGVDGQREAKDTIYSWAFSRSPGGTHYHFSGPDPDQDESQTPVEPPPQAMQRLQALNETQMLLDACRSTARQYRWDMFAAWWKYVSDASGKDNPDFNHDFRTLPEGISARLAAIQQRIVSLEAIVDGMLKDRQLATAKPASQPVFHLSKDPTLLIGGVESGWPLDYLDKVTVRTPSQTITPEGSLPAALQTTIELLQGKLPQVFRLPAASLLAEFLALGLKQDSGPAPQGRCYPQFHDNKTTDGRWRDQWGDRQPWFPLYAEWEVEYTHIPFELWKLDEHTARLSANKLVRYGVSVPDDKPLWEYLDKHDKHDTRVLSGRVLLLPQPSFSLQAKVQQLFDTTPPDILDQYLSAEKRQELLGGINKLAYLSCTLTGLGDGLVTLAQGSHIKPENKTVGPNGEHSSVMDAAVFDDAGLTRDKINLIQNNSALTPYAALSNLPDTGPCPFKPVTHGQFRFRKLNLIDKFGQSLMVIDQAPRVGGPPPIYPAISDFYEPQTITVDGHTHANTVLQQKPGQCEFVQLPMQINQNARLNAAFVLRSEKAWRVATEWEMPIWGWVVTNYADYGIQVFLPDGSFYREVRFGGPLGALKEPSWIPFPPDRSTHEQLDALVEKLMDPSYLEGFWHMITTAQDKLRPAPSSYAQFLNSVVGRPLALVNMGWSLELDGPPLTNQTSAAKNPERSLTDEGKTHYAFQVRLGDQDSAHDGLVGYFDCTSSGLDLEHINTFFSNGKAPLRHLETGTYPLFTPFWEPPMPATPPFDPITPDEFTSRRNAHMSVFGALLDPFTPVHAYSSFLPPVALALPAWTWQSAMNTMTAFLHAGPLPMRDIPAFVPAEILTAKNVRDRPKREVELQGPSGEWSWLQPYMQDGQKRVYNAFGLDKRGDKLSPGFEEGPYVAVEGFLQLRKPIMRPEEGGG